MNHCNSQEASISILGVDLVPVKRIEDSQLLPLSKAVVWLLVVVNCLLLLPLFVFFFV